ncbi:MULTISPECIES: hypothetical protein [Hyphomicrobiales]|jgi:hypothetical protein|uniref:hypothetical protein n=1 Tax=Methylobacterium sp. CCH7-A2 TaxID=1768789 RepID=UPI0008352E59|nr:MULTISPECIES: hypothetical protein [Hyphomicrobiales]
MSKIMPTQSIKPLTPGPVPAPLDLEWSDLANLHDALLTFSDVCCGLQCQPRFQKDRIGGLNDAGLYLAEIDQLITSAANSIAERALDAKATDPEGMHRVLMLEEVRVYESTEVIAEVANRPAGSRS